MTIKSTRAVLGALIAAAALSACSPPPKPDFARLAQWEACDEELAAINQRANAGMRRAHVAEAAYIATRNEKIANANAKDIEADTAQLKADMEAYKAHCMRH